jgi:hypothetical protein
MSPSLEIHQYLSNNNIPWILSSKMGIKLPTSLFNLETKPLTYKPSVTLLNGINSTEIIKYQSPIMKDTFVAFVASNQFESCESSSLTDIKGNCYKISGSDIEANNDDYLLLDLNSQIEVEEDVVEEEEEDLSVIPTTSADNRKIKLTEKVDKPVLQHIIKNSKDFKIGKQYNNSNLISEEAQLSLLIDYYNLLDDSGQIKMGYYQHNGFGRQWSRASLSLATMKRQVRHTIARKSYYDIDMKNAHPTLLLHYCHKNNIKCNHLQYFVDNREFCYESYGEAHRVDRETAKKRILAILNGGEYKSQLGWFNNLKTELKNDIFPLVKELNPEFHKIAVVSKLKKFGSEKNVDGTCVNYVLCDLENTCLMLMFDYLRHHTINIGSLVFDGLMIEKVDIKDQTHLSKILKGLERFITFHMDGLRMPILEKPMNEGFTIENTIELEPPIERIVQSHQPDLPLTGLDWVLYQNLLDLKPNGYISITGVSERYVNDLNFTYSRCIGIKSAMGSGKTTAICRYIAKHNPERVLVLSPRISFAKSITFEYNNKACSANNQEEFVCYHGKSVSEVFKANRLVISMESLWKLENANQSIKSYDLIVVDECQANLVQHTSISTNGSNLSKNIKLFGRLLMNNCNRIVFADAFLSVKTLDFLKNLGLRTHIYRYDNKMIKREAIEIEGKDSKAFIEAVASSLERGEKSYVFVSAKTKLQIWSHKLKQEFPNKTILAYSGGSKIPDDINSTWAKADIVMTTSTITVGVNFDTPNVFHNVFIYASNRSSNRVSDIFQSHYRVRHLINNKLYYFITDFHDAPGLIHRTLIHNYLDWKEYKMKNKSIDFEEADVQMRQLLVDNIWEENVSSAYLRKIFHLYLQECNYDILDKEDVNYSELTHAWTQTDTAGDVSDHLAYEDIPVLTADAKKELTRLKNKGFHITDQQHVELEKRHFAECFAGHDEANVTDFCNDEESCELFDLWNDFKKPNIWNLNHEKHLYNGTKTIEQMFQSNFQKCNIAILHKDTYHAVEYVRQFTKILEINHSCDIDTVISKNNITNLIDHLNTPECKNVSTVFKLRNKAPKAKLTDAEKFSNGVKLINSIFKSFGLTTLKVAGSQNNRVNGKIVFNPNRPYQLQYKDGINDGGVDLVWNHINAGTQVETTDL